MNATYCIINAKPRLASFYFLTVPLSFLTIRKTHIEILKSTSYKFSIMIEAKASITCKVGLPTFPT
jgi:hypothetical protein